MIRRKPCGCVLDIKYESSFKGLQMKIEKTFICDKHKEKPKMKSKIKHNKRTALCIRCGYELSDDDVGYTCNDCLAEKCL